MKRPLIDFIPGAVPAGITFDSEPVIQYDHSEGYWLLFRKPIYRLHQDWSFGFSLDGEEWKVTARAGFLTDLASTPKIIWWLYPPFDGQYGKPALGHDILYAGEILDRPASDSFLRTAMGLCGASATTLSLFYNAVRDWGWLVWRNHTEDSIRQARDLIIVEKALG